MNTFKFRPLGGLRQIGSNMISVTHGSDHILIDAGILFPYEDVFNINYLIPQFHHIQTPTHLIITHGHEDHIGAITHVLERFPQIQLWATPFTAELIRRKLEHKKLSHQINIFNENKVFEFKNFNIHPIHMNHSIPETMGLFFGDKSFNDSFFYASDFKVDESSPYERPFNLKKLERISLPYKRRVLFADSTNITSSQSKTPGEGELINTFEHIFSQNRKRFFVTTFSSNIHRLHTLFSSCQKNNLKVVLYGRSSQFYVEAAKKCGLLTFPDSLFIDATEAKEKRVMILAAGCQGDFRSAFKRIASGNDKFFSPTRGDLFILSSKPIPGNEKKINLLINQLSESGADIITHSDQLVHASGHPGKDDLKILIKHFNPQLVIPIHGESHFLKKHQKFIKEDFNINSKILYNFDALIFDEAFDIVPSKEENLPILIYGNGIEIEREAISQRRKLAGNGCIFITITKNKNIQLSHLGLPDIFENQLKSNLENLISRLVNGAKTKEEIRIETRRFCDSKMGHRPVVVIH